MEKATFWNVGMFLFDPIKETLTKDDDIGSVLVLKAERYCILKIVKSMQFHQTRCLRTLIEAKDCTHLDTNRNSLLFPASDIMLSSLGSRSETFKGGRHDNNTLLHPYQHNLHPDGWYGPGISIHLLLFAMSGQPVLVSLPTEH